jgi:flagellar motor switch protein FliN
MAMSADVAGPEERIDELLDVPLTIEARFEDRLMTLDELRKVQAGAVVPLRRAAGETLDVYVGNVRLASAEVVVIEDRLTLRITEFNLVKQ